MRRRGYPLENSCTLLAALSYGSAVYSADTLSVHCMARRDIYREQIESSFRIDSTRKHRLYV